MTQPRAMLVYQRVSEYPLAGILVTPEELLNGYAQFSCQECSGTGQFLLPDDEMVDCVCCRGTGKMWVSL